MTYTDTKPTRTGWYGYLEIAKGLQIVYVVAFPGAVLCSTYGVKVADMPGRWSRRLIEEPKQGDER